MESLSRTFHSIKLSNATSTTTFSPENAYHGVFSGHRQNFAGASGIDVHDYGEIFATSSILVLDLSIFGEPVEIDDDMSLKDRNSKPDYSKVFGGFRGEEDDAVCYEEWFIRDNARSLFLLWIEKKKVIEDKHYAIDASIVRIMKSRSWVWNMLNNWEACLRVPVKRELMVGRVRRDLHHWMNVRPRCTEMRRTTHMIQIRSFSRYQVLRNQLLVITPVTMENHRNNHFKLHPLQQNQVFRTPKVGII